MTKDQSNLINSEVFSGFLIKDDEVRAVAMISGTPTNDGIVVGTPRELSKATETKREQPKQSYLCGSE